MQKVAVMRSGHMIPIMGSNKEPAPDLEPSSMVAPAAGIAGGSTWGWSANTNHQHTNIGVASIGVGTNRMTMGQQHGSGIVEVVGAERAEGRVSGSPWRWSPARWVIHRGHEARTDVLQHGGQQRQQRCKQQTSGQTT